MEFTPGTGVSYWDDITETMFMSKLHSHVHVPDEKLEVAEKGVNYTTYRHKDKYDLCFTVER